GGKLFVVGIGPGDAEQMTFKAREAIARSEVVIGYKAYIQLIEAFLGQKEVIAPGMGTEVERVKRALSLAREGRTVSLVSSGDAGIYGMAGLVGEMLGQPTGAPPDIEVIPGVPALAATAALLGAPLSGDFAAISLSDYLVSWTEISQRLKLAAQANFVIVLYNPKSRQRQQALTRAKEIIGQYRSPLTAVGIVTNAYRRKQQITITDLAHMLDYEVGMNTTIIIGNSTTSVSNDWMVTPRGYQTRYNLKDGA
ncbi:MAG: precorrin-3B C(17)-methyltransferase, partial [Chloroflexi bacterium]|nr:precorrin-3B C(17)-methyltransferase [Chloroflexota bacterium]